MNTDNKRRITIPVAQISYPHIITPKAFDEDDPPKWSASFVFPEGTDLSALKAAVKAAGEEKFGEKKFAQLVKSGKISVLGGPGSSIRTDVEDKNYPEGAAAFINASEKNRKPGLVSLFPDPETGRPTALTDEQAAELFYPGAMVRASVTAYGYDYKGNKGVTWGLNNVAWAGHGQRLDGSISAVDEFTADASLIPEDPFGEQEEEQDDVMAALGA